MSKYILLLALVSASLSTSEFVAALHQKPHLPTDLTCHLQDCIKDLNQAKATIKAAISALNHFNPHQAEALGKQFITLLGDAHSECSQVTKKELLKWAIANTTSAFKLCLTDIVVALKGVPLIGEDIYRLDWENLVKDLRGEAHLVEFAIQDCGKVTRIFK